jgi:hypothetical protein
MAALCTAVIIDRTALSMIVAWALPYCCSARFRLGPSFQLSFAAVIH